MENYTQLITEQAKALQKDIAEYNDEIFSREELLEDLKKKRDEARKVLRGIEKKLAGK